METVLKAARLAGPNICRIYPQMSINRLPLIASALQPALKMQPEWHVLPRSDKLQAISVLSSSLALFIYKF
jgi:hypothetical protein